MTNEENIKEFYRLQKELREHCSPRCLCSMRETCPECADILEQLSESGRLRDKIDNIRKEIINPICPIHNKEYNFDSIGGCPACQYNKSYGHLKEMIANRKVDPSTPKYHFGKALVEDDLGAGI